MCTLLQVMVDFVLKESGWLDLYEFKNLEVRYMERKHHDEELHFGKWKSKVEIMSTFLTFGVFWSFQCSVKGIH